MQSKLLQKIPEFCVLPPVILNTLCVSFQAGSQRARHTALIASLFDTLSLLLIASEPL